MPIALSRRLLPLFALALLTLPAAVLAAEPAPTTIELSAEASSKAENDLGRAHLYFEATDADPAALAARVNRVIAEALERAKASPAVAVSTAGSSTYPVHSRDGAHIDGWRMRSTIELESRDIAALSALIGRLQQTLAIAGVNMQPAPDTRSKAANVAAVDAIRAFEERAAVLSNALGKRYRIRHLSVQHGGGMPVYPMMRVSAMAAEAAMPAPLQAGHSDVTVNVTGTIELTD